MSADVVALGAWCDLVPPEEDTASPGRAEARPRSGWSAAPREGNGATPGGASFRVCEFAVLGDGRRITLHCDRGFTSWSRRSGETQLLDAWGSLTRESVESDVRNVVLPDDDSEDEHPYEWLRELLLHQGIETSAEQLRSVPYMVEFSDRLERRLSAGREPDGE